MRSIIAVTGISGLLGQALLRCLDMDDRVDMIIGVDIKEPERQSSKLRFYRKDVNDPGLTELFKESGVQRVVHLAFVLDAIHDAERARHVDIDGTRNVLEAAIGAGAKVVVVASSPVVYGARSDNPRPIPETNALRPDHGLRYGADKEEVERLCSNYQDRHPDIAISTVRVVTITGPHMNNFISRGFEKPVHFIPLGFDPAWQFIHESDAAFAFQTLAFAGLRGPFNLAADGVARISEVSNIMGKPIVRLPRFLMRSVTEIGWQLRLRAISEFPGALVDYLCYPPIVDTQKLKDAVRITFRYTSMQAIADYFASKTGTTPHL